MTETVEITKPVYNDQICKMCASARRRSTSEKKKAGKMIPSILYWRCTSFGSPCEKCFDGCKEYQRLKEKYKIEM